MFPFKIINLFFSILIGTVSIYFIVLAKQNRFVKIKPIDSCRLYTRCTKMDSDDVSNSSNNDSKTEEIDTSSNSIKKTKHKIENIDDESSKSSIASEAPKMLQLRPIDQLLSPRVKGNQKHIRQMQTIDLLSDNEDDDGETIMILPVAHPSSSSKSQKISSKRSGSDASSSKCNASSNSKADRLPKNSVRSANKVRVTIKRLPKNLQPLLHKHKLKAIVNEKQKVIASISGTIDLKKRIQNEVKLYLKPKIAKEKCYPLECINK